MDETPKRRVGRPSKYDWGDKRDICYKLYVEEKKSAQDIAKYFADRFNVSEDELPCKKGFLRQFQVWGFPSRINKLSEEDERTVTNRIKEMWEQNISQKDIRETLAEEGWDLKGHVFNKMWKKNGLRLRIDQGYKPPDPNAPPKKRKRTSTAAEGATENVNPVDAIDFTGQPSQQEQDAMLSMSLDPDEAARRAQRLFEIQLESDQRLSDRKRRRRIRGYGHLPPDEAGLAPRYASETSLDECKAYLQLSNEKYQAIRGEFEVICRELGIIKKTECAEGVWEECKKRLIRESMHLSAVMHPLQPDQDKKTIALDCVCCDVTKRMRVQGKSITIAQANNILGLNPEESKEIRRCLYDILTADNFESRLVSGEDHYQELRRQWFASNEKLQQIVAENEPTKKKAVELLGKDAMKRFREDKNRRGERVIVQKNAHYGPGPGPAWMGTAPRSKKAKAAEAAKTASPTIREPHVRAAVEGGGYPPQRNGNLLTTVAQATGNIDFGIDPALAATGPFTAPQTTAAQPIPAYFKLAPGSSVVGNHPRMWLGKLASGTISALHKAATSKAGAARVTKVHGVVKDPDGTESSWLVENEDELEVYLGEAGEKATFLVVLEGGYA
ncbi:hypothetical protein PRZ48_004991 [Zasmidium cellare]|uniref:Clr5 domain-containing protein n=1 Tax=Zasmidium cellare TaxID=395010 RepID=A0ABR0ER40_ZASCE|nr:hypothetical protein PRZ48_004991 [Zasmidium cellare]